MQTLWFILVGFMLTMYVVLDGFDLGAGAIHLFAAKNDEERRMILRAIGPVWDGNEVWLIAAGGTIFFTFPLLYASSFSGFYLPLIIVLWLLMFRGVSVELRSRIANPVWASFWDGMFFLGSTLLAIFFGAAMANVIRGVPLDKSGIFFEALWTDFNPFSANPGILDWYTVLVGNCYLCRAAADEHKLPGQSLGFHFSRYCSYRPHRGRLFQLQAAGSCLLYLIVCLHRGHARQRSLWLIPFTSTGGQPCE